MNSVHCKNPPQKGSDKDHCERILGGIPDSIVEFLKKNHTEKLIYRCPRCYSSIRWVSVGFDESGDFEFKTLDEPPIFNKRIDFQKITTGEAVA
jgi:hypothetical protein